MSLIEKKVTANCLLHHECGID